MKKDLIFPVLVCLSLSALADEELDDLMRPPPMSAPALSVEEYSETDTGSAPDHFASSNKNLLLKNKELMDLVRNQEAMIKLLEERVRSLEGGR